MATTQGTQHAAGQVQAIPLNLIDPWDNHRTEAPDPAEIKELADSIGKVGLLQPILVRPGKKAGRFQLIAGFRRFAAFRILDPTFSGDGKILANVRDLDDAQAFDAQMTENLQRKDVSPMDEAKAFTAMLESGRYTMADIAARVAKAESYVAQRLKLMDLIKPLQKHLQKGDLPIGHAMELAKLSAEDQNDITDDILGEYSDGIPTLDELKKLIGRNYLGNLSQAPWKKDDANLVPAAGPCTTCPKRSGANPSLFPDVKQTDRCFDRTCYALKSATFIEVKVLETIEKEPDTLFLVHRWQTDPPASVLKTLEAQGIKPLEEYTHFDINAKGNMRGLWLNGDNAGKKQAISLRKQSNGTTTTTKKAGQEETGMDFKLAIEGIKARTARANELESQRTHKTLKEALDDDDHEEGKAMGANNRPLDKFEICAALVMFYEARTYGVDDLIEEVVDKALGKKKGAKDGPYIYDTLRIIDQTKLEALFYQCIRLEMIERLTKNPNTSPEKDDDARAVEELAIHYMPQLTKGLYEQKKAATDKRNASAEKRIADLKKKQAMRKPRKLPKEAIEASKKSTAKNATKRKADPGGRLLPVGAEAHADNAPAKPPKGKGIKALIPTK